MSLRIVNATQRDQAIMLDWQRPIILARERWKENFLEIKSYLLIFCILMLMVIKSVAILNAKL